MNKPNSRYADAMERALYNTVIGGMSHDGKSFIYVNPLEVHPQSCKPALTYHYVKTVRQGWFGCACCPPNVARLLASLGQYVYTVKEDAVYANLYDGGEARLSLDGKQVTLTINNVNVSLEGLIVDGYAMLHREWDAGETVELNLPMEVSRMKGHPLMRHAVGKTALQRGPLVYCLEQADNGANLHQLVLPRDAELVVQEEAESIGGIYTVTADGNRSVSTEWGEELYLRNASITEIATPLKFIPYYVWANRGEGEMRVWIEEK